MVETKTDGEKRYDKFTEHAEMLWKSGEAKGCQLTRLLLQLGVLDIDGYVHKPTKTAVLELLKWHAGGGFITAVPVQKLAIELGCGRRGVDDLLKELESDGLIVRHHGCAPGNLYTTEIVGPKPEPEPVPLTPTQEHLLEVLRSNMNAEGFVQTNEHELAIAIDVSHETALLSLITLRRLGYVSATFAEYGRPCIVKVVHDHPVKISSDVDTGDDMQVAEEESLDKEGRLMRFLRWQLKNRQEEQEQLDELIGSLGD